MTIQQANQYFAALPDGFADPAQLGALLPASVQQVQFVGVAGTAGKTAVARLLAAILHAQGIRAGVYHAGCEPLAARIRVDGKLTLWEAHAIAESVHDSVETEFSKVKHIMVHVNPC